MADDGDGGFFGSLFGGGGGGDWTTDDVAALDAAELEELLELLYDAEGADVERAAPNVEGGIRLIVRESGLLGSKKVVVTPRPAEFTVSRGSVENLERARSMNGADRAELVRPAPFDRKVRDAADGTKVTLVDAEDLVARLNRSGVQA